AFVSDGDLMEGISYEAASLAGHFGLGRLVYLYDDNQISIDGATTITFGDDVPGRFEAVGWHTLTVDGHDREAIAQAIAEARSVEDRPSLICCKTRIGKGAPNLEGSPKSHGSPLGADEIRGAKEAMGFDPNTDFFVDPAVYEFFSQAMERGREAHA